MRRVSGSVILAGLLLLTVPFHDARASESLSRLAQTADSLLLEQAIDSAFVLARAGLRQAELTYGRTDSAAGTWLNILAICHFHAAQFDSAEQCWTRALAIWKSSLGDNNPMVAKTYNNLGTLCQEQGRFDDAVPLITRALHIWESAYGMRDPRVAPAANNLAYTLYKAGELSRAEHLFRRADTLWSVAYGVDYPHAIRARINLGMVYADQGRFTEAESIYRETLRQQEQSLGPDHPDVAFSLNNLAHVCWAENRRVEARRMSERAVAIYEAALGPDHPYLSYGLSNLALLDWELGDYEQSERLLLRALDIAEAAYGEVHLSVAQTLNDLGIVYQDWGKYEQAEAACLRALDIRERLLGPHHPLVAQSLHNLAIQHQWQGRRSEAAELNRQAYDIWQSNYGADYYQLSDCLLLMAMIAAQEGDRVGAREAAFRALAIRRRNFEANAAVLSEHDALHYAGRLRDAVDRYLTFALATQPIDSLLSEQIAATVLSTKGQVADQIFLRRAQSVAADSLTADLQREIQALKYRLANLRFSGPGDDIAAFRAECDRLGSEIADREGELARVGGVNEPRPGGRSTELEDARRMRPEGVCLVEYMRYAAYQDNRTTATSERYLAVVIDVSGCVNVVELGPAEAVDGAIRAYRDHVSRVALNTRPPDQQAEREYRVVAGDVYRRVWQPLRLHLADARMVFVAGDGLLNLVSIGALPADGGRYVLEEHGIHYLSALRDIARVDHRSGSAAGLLALGDPDFFASVSQRTEDLHVVNSAGGSTKFAGLRSVPIDCLELNDLVVSPLPGTRSEVLRIVEEWNREESTPATVLLGAVASEESFKSRAAGHRVLHLATHGYYLPTDCGFQDTSGIGEAATQKVHPLLRSGLLLAGANLHERPGNDTAFEDGNLSAYEVAELDLSGTRLVVLSACETGLGDIMEGEGVYGLRRAFLLAGAGTVVSALWPVSDDHAVGLMSGLYEGGVDGIAVRLRRAQLLCLAQLRAEGKPDHPLSWGSFVAVGDWD
ncbi:CHAT domain-containing protein [bacterium]|nr:CHAT domain-containing protein [bacterium]